MIAAAIVCFIAAILLAFEAGRAHAQEQAAWQAANTRRLLAGTDLGSRGRHPAGRDQ